MAASHRPTCRPPAGETFSIGGSKTLRSCGHDSVALVGAGVTVHHCLIAADQLAAEGIDCRVIDAYSIKPIDAGTLIAAAQMTGGRLVVVEDHHPEGGLGSAVLEALAGQQHPPTVAHLAVRNLPGSGRPEELMDAAGIGPAAIIAAVHALLADRDGRPSR